MDFIVPKDNIQNRNKYFSCIANECKLYGTWINLDECVKEWRDTILHLSLVLGSKKALLQDKPCILNLDNHVGENLILKLFHKGLDSWTGSKKYFVEEVEAIIQKQILGAEI